MTEMSAFKKLVSLNPSKAHGSDEIPGWLLKENADLLTIPICDIINCSYQEGRLPSAWKEANVIPVPKQRPIKDVNITIEFITLEGIEEIKTEKNDNKTLRRILFSPAL